MYTDEELVQLEEEEHSHAVETFALILLMLSEISSDLEKEYNSFYQKYGKDGVVTYNEARKWVSEKDHRRRITVMFLLIASLFDNAFIDFENNFRNHLMHIIETEAKYFGVDLDIDDILNTPWGVDELTWMDRLYAYQDKWIATISNDFKTLLHKRSSLDDVLDELAERFESMEKLLWKLYVTETTAIGSLARREIFKELGIKKYRFYTREDERTCEHCGSLHGLTFPISAFEIGVTASPIHPYCRCFEIPIID